MLRSVDGSSIGSFSTPGPVTIDTLESETLTSNSATVKTLNYFSTGVTSLPSTLGNVPLSIDTISLTMANSMAATHKPFGAQQITSLDLTSANPDLKGFAGGFTDGRYGYFVPLFNGSYFGLIARVDLQNFAVGGITTLDLSAVNASLKGFNGGFTDGRYGYFVPFYNGSYSGLIARVDLQNFTVGGVTTLDLTSANPDLKGFQGGFTDGRYGYFVPNNNGSFSGLIARVDLQNFTVGGVTTLDLTSANADLKGFLGGFTDGRYGYFVPYNNGSLSGLVARVDLQNFTVGGVTTLDLTSANAGLKGFRGGFTDGQYGYFVPNESGLKSYSGLVGRVDLQNFTVGGVTPLDLTSANTNFKGFSGGFTDGRYGYFVPYNNGSRFGRVARVDLQNFTVGGVTPLNLVTANTNLRGFVGGFTDGRYGYFVPNTSSAIVTPTYSGLVARVQITVPPYLYNSSV